jgi:hypothetical protein
MKLFVTDRANAFLLFYIEDKVKFRSAGQANVLTTGCDVNADAASLLDAVTKVKLVPSLALIAQTSGANQVWIQACCTLSHANALFAVTCDVLTRFAKWNSIE